METTGAEHTAGPDEHAELRKLVPKVGSSDARAQHALYEGIAERAQGDPSMMVRIALAINLPPYFLHALGENRRRLRQAAEDGGRVEWSRRGELKVILPKGQLPAKTPIRPPILDSGQDALFPPEPTEPLEPDPPPASPPPPAPPRPPPTPPPPSSHRHRNLFDEILEMGHDEDFAPREGDKEFVATDAPAGSRAKVDVLTERVRLGLPLWHPEDREDNEGLAGLPRARSNH